MERFEEHAIKHTMMTGTETKGLGGGEGHAVGFVAARQVCLWPSVSVFTSGYASLSAFLFSKHIPTDFTYTSPNLAPPASTPEP